MKTINIGKIVVTRDSEGYYNWEHIYNDKVFPINLSYKEFVESLESLEFDDAFYYNNSKDFYIKVSKTVKTKNGIVKKNGSVVFKNFEDLKNDELFEDLKPRIYPLLKKRAMAATRKLLVSGAKKILIGASAIGIIFGCTKLYQTGIFTDNTDSKTDNSSNIDSITMSYSDDSSTADNSLVRNDSYKEIKDKFYYYGAYYNLNQFLIDDLYTQHKEKFVESTNLDYDIMTFIYDYYTENLYGQLVVTPNTINNDEQCLTILKYAQLKGVTDEEVLYTMLAVHDLETGWGKSELCVKDNNFGGNTFGDDFQTYPSYEVGAYDYVNDFVRIYKDTYTGINSIEYDMNPVYCTENVENVDTPWYAIVGDIKERLKKVNALEHYLDQLNEKVKVKTR